MPGVEAHLQNTVLAQDQPQFFKHLYSVIFNHARVQISTRSCQLAICIRCKYQRTLFLNMIPEENSITRLLVI